MSASVPVSELTVPIPCGYRVTGSAALVYDAGLGVWPPALPPHHDTLPSTIKRSPAVGRTPEQAASAAKVARQERANDADIGYMILVTVRPLELSET
jgi:hypothetical protein